MTRPSERLKNTQLSTAPAKGLQTKNLKQSLKLENTGNSKRENLKRGTLKQGNLKRSVKGVARKFKTQLSGQLANKPSAKSASTADNFESGKTTTVKRLPFVKDTKGSRLALNLLLVRPWFLLAGFWVVSLVSAAVAWEGMISPKVLTMDLPQPQAEDSPATDKNSFLSVEQTPEAGAQTAQQNTPNAKTAAERSAAEGSDAKSSAPKTADTGGFPTWPLGALVGTCAAGCLAISRRRAMVRLAATTQVRGKRRVRPNAAPQAIHKQSSPLVGSSGKGGRPLKVVATRKSNKSKQSSQRLQPKGQPIKGQLIKSQPIKGQPPRIKTAAVQIAGQSPVRGLVKPKKRRQRRRPPTAQSTPRPATGTPVLASRSSASRSNLQRSQAAGTAQNRPQRRKQSSSMRGLKRNQSVVSVVPASESNALDWRNGSLAHQLDVRPQRTASM